MINVRLSATDIANIRFAISPLVQVGHSAATNLATQESPPHRHRQAQLFRALPHRAEPLMRLRQFPEYIFPDFVTPPPLGRLCLDDELQTLLETPQWRVQNDLEPWVQRSFTHHTHLIASRKARLDLVTAVRAYHDTAIDDWPSVQRILEEDVERRCEQIARHGIDHMLRNLHPRLGWQNPVLTIGLRRPGAPAEIDLRGRGVVLAPSVFWRSTMTTKLNDWDPLVLVYPAGVRRAPRRPSAERALRLSRAFGKSRAAVLIGLFESPGMTTTAVADHCQLSVASASEHLSVLREVGLTSAERHGMSVRHSLTRPGWDLVARRRST